MTMVSQAIQQRSGHPLSLENLSPFTECQITGNQHIKQPRVGTQVSHTHAIKQSPPKPATAERRFGGEKTRDGSSRIMYIPYGKVQPHIPYPGSQRFFNVGESGRMVRENRHLLHHPAVATETRNHDPDAKGEMSREFPGAIQTNALSNALQHPDERAC